MPKPKFEPTPSYDVFIKRGMWKFVKKYDGTENLRFEVQFVDQKGQIHRVYALSSLSRDVRNAIAGFQA